MIYLRKKTFGKNICSDYIHGMRIFPVKMKTHEKSRKWFERDCMEKHTHLYIFVCRDSFSCDLNTKDEA